ncbi:MAG: recombinase family protein [Firmicutes bacterium]|nr:recombinase family protein [Bacillota bacterium]
MHRVVILYRVSTKKQVDKQKDDIPMQKLACQEFAREKGWVIVKEFYEKGVSGFKVSANDRDAIQDLKEMAANKEFDVLLVYMFDRLGRIDSETPFVVEWFINNGIEVWSTQEGQQKLDDQVDKLMNYIRFWQANGESVKTSMRLKTRMAQLAKAGIYRGGNVPFGYKTVNNGRLNKKGQPVRDVEVDIEEANIVKMIFDKTLNEGYGSYRMAEYINSLGIKTHFGSKFQSNTVIRILKNRLYCGYYIAGESSSPKIDSLVIIDENVFDSVQKILKQRTRANDEKQHIARTTKGCTLLSGNIYCGHCGGHLNAAKNVEIYKRADGTVRKSEYIRYTCYHKARGLNDCNGQSVYSAPKIDAIVLGIVRDYLKRIKETPKDRALETKYQKDIDSRKKEKKKLSLEAERLSKSLDKLSVEIGKSLSGISEYSPEMLKLSINTTTAQLNEINGKIAKCEEELDKKKEMLDNLDFYYDSFAGWADEFDNAGMEQKKMIICQLINAVKVRKGYEIEIEFNMSYERFFEF